MGDTIKLSYNPKTGKRLIEVHGVQGPSCDNLLEKIEQVIGNAGERVRKDEYYTGDGQTNEGKNAQSQSY